MHASSKANAVVKTLVLAKESGSVPSIRILMMILNHLKLQFQGTQCLLMGLGWAPGTHEVQKLCVDTPTPTKESEYIF